MNKEYNREITEIYNSIKYEIVSRISSFKDLWRLSGNDEIFCELAFCIFTPQSKAKSCYEAVNRLKEKDLLACGRCEQISEVINIVRFRNNKARYLVEAREKFFTGQHNFKKTIDDIVNVSEKRDWLVDNIKGIGYKEASHFLRNTGFGDDIAILDRHILKNLVFAGVIKTIPKTLTRTIYLQIEDDMRQYSDKINIPMGHLDFVLWYKEAGEVFK